MKRNYWPLWGILASAFVIFFLLSMCPDDLSIGGVALKKSKMAQIFMPDTTQIQVINITDTIQNIDNKSKFPVETDTVPKTILFIGDSMLEGLSPRLAAYCDVSGHKLYTVIWYSSTTEIWGSEKLLSKYISEIKPDYIFICLGANELFISNIKEKRDKYVKSLLAEIGNIPYLWIGPPNWKPDTGINEMIESNVPEGNFFLTNGMKFNRKKDGAHPTSESAIVWMDSIARWMPLHSAHPIVLNNPEKKTSRPVKVFLHQPKK